MALQAIGGRAIPAQIEALCTDANMTGNIANTLAAMCDPAIRAVLQHFPNRPFLHIPSKSLSQRIVDRIAQLKFSFE